MSKVIEFKRRTVTDQAEPFPWIVAVLDGRTLTIMACNPFDAMERAAEKIEGPVTFTCVIPEDDGIDWRPEWDVPPEGWAIAE